jgi:hypothetical protein
MGLGVLQPAPGHGQPQRHGLRKKKFKSADFFTVALRTSHVMLKGN